MAQSDDPFFHHPRLRDQIVPPETSFYRSLTTEGIREMMEANGIFDAPLHSDASRDALRDILIDYQHPVAKEIMDFQIELAVKESTDIDFVPERFRPGSNS